MVTKENCKVVGAWSALMGIMVIVMSTVFFDQCLKLHNRYTPTEHLEKEETKKNYNGLLIIGMIGIFEGVAQTLMSLTMYWGVQKKLKDYRRVYLFCIGESINFMLLIASLTVAMICKAYLVTEALLNKNYEAHHEEKYPDQHKQVTNHIGAAFCLILGIDLFVVSVCLLFLGYKLKRREYDNV